jgi:uncharacterized membrane protein
MNININSQKNSQPTKPESTSNGIKIRKSEIISFFIVLIAFGLGYYFYPQLPEKMASHWNAQGQVNGYMTKFWGAYLMPIISLSMLILFLFIPRIDPKKENIEKFRKYFDVFIILIQLFLIYLYLLTIFWNLNYSFNFNRFLVPAFAVLFYYVGILVGKAQMNWSIGIRTPWTLSNEKVWNKTHKLGGLLFKVSAVIGLTGMIFDKIAVWILVLPLLFTAILTFIYSYIIYKHETGTNNQKT